MEKRCEEEKTTICGTCTMCCKLYNIKDIKKHGEWCPNVCTNGCKIYEERPEVCRNYSCVYRDMKLSPNLRPDKLKAIIEYNGQYDSRLVFSFITSDCYTKRKEITKEIDKQVRAGNIVRIASESGGAIFSKLPIEDAEKLRKIIEKQP